MSAIIPFQETVPNSADSDAVRAARAYLRSLPPLPARPQRPSYRVASGPVVGASGAAKLTEAVLQSSHAELTRLVYLRNALLKLLEGTTITAVERPDLGRRGDEAEGGGVSDTYLELRDPQTGEPKGITSADAQLWFYLPEKGGSTFALLSGASKMACPSFSLPAGAPLAAGACPAALAQTINPQAATPDQPIARAVQQLTGEPLNLARSTCQLCYATGGNYNRANVQLAQLVRLLWTRSALGDTSTDPAFSNFFVQAMVQTIKSARFAGWDGRGPRFFRLHDSGDFFDQDYFLAWCEIARVFEDPKNRVMFWAPTRMWAVKGWAELITRHAPKNLVVRPSAYMVNGPAPQTDGPEWRGWAGGTTVVEAGKLQPGNAETELFDWNCRAYATVDEAHACPNAIRPTLDAAGRPVLDAEGKVKASQQKGCRACWLAPQLKINYTLH